jgi:T-complex protein 1 subunit gamma
MAEPLLQRNFHPTVIIRGYYKALEKALQVCKSISRTIDCNDDADIQEVVTSAIGTKFSARWGKQMVNMAIQAVRKIVIQRGDYKEIDVKRYVRVEKIPGGEVSECCVLDGVMFNKDVTHSKMRRRIENPRILLLDCPLEYKKSESGANVEISNEEDFNALLRQEEEYIEQICAQV